MTERIGLMGGMFDPPHPGHRAIASSFLRSGYIDRLWILPTAHPPHKSSSATDYHHRLAMCRFAFDGLVNCDVSDIESEMATPNYTLFTLQHVHNLHPDVQFCLCIGSDSLNRFTTWFRWEDILRTADLLVAVRNGDEATIPESLTHHSRHIRFIPHEPVKDSSTHYRNHPESGLHPKVARYIALNELY